MSTDWVDGVIARRTGQVSELGKILDPVADRPQLGFEQSPAEHPLQRLVRLLGDGAEQELSDALGGLEHDVAGEAVADRDIAGTGEQLSPLDVAGEVHRRGLQQGERGLHQLRALARLLAVAEQGDAWLADAEHPFGEHAAHDRELGQPLGTAIGVGADIENEDLSPAAGEHRSDGGPADPADATDREQGGGEHGTTVAGADRGGGAPLGNLPADADDRGVALCSHRVGGMLVHPHHLGCLDDLQVLPRGRVTGGKLRQLALDVGAASHQGDVDLQPPHRRGSAANHLARRMVAAHGVDRDQHPLQLYQADH